MNFSIFLIKLFICLYLITHKELAEGSITIFNDKNETTEIVDSVSAAFGPSISEFGFLGYIVVASPIGGCSPLQKAPNVSWVDPDQWIVLIKRTPTIFGNCSFDLKVRNAQIAGFKAVIIYNSESDNLIKMSSSGKYDIQIPSVFISHSNGIEIGQYYTYMNRTYAIINNDDDNLNYLLIPFICVVAVCFIIAISIFVSKFIFHIYKLRKNRFPKSALKKIPTKKYQKTDKYDTCPICLNEYEEGEKIRILPCEHAYHVECIDKWLLRNNRFCPVCKRRVLPGGPSDSESEDGQDPITNSSQLNVPNDDENTNESSRLLVNVRNDNDDNISSATFSTMVHNTDETVLVNPSSNNNSNQVNTDFSSMNNQMTASLTSSQAPQNLNKDLRSSSSRYGSIASSLNIIGNVATTSKSTESETLSDSDTKPDSKAHKTEPTKQPIELIDSKATPEFYSPIESSLPSSTNQKSDTSTTDTGNIVACKNTQIDLPNAKVSGKKRSSKRKNKVGTAVEPSAAAVNDHSVDKTAVDANLNDNDDDDDDNEKKVLLKTSKKHKKKSLSQTSSTNTNLKSGNTDENNDSMVG